MKITIEQEGQEPKVIDGVLGYQLIVTTAETTQTYGRAGEEIGILETLTMAEAIEKLYRKFEIFVKMRKAYDEVINNDGEQE